MSIAIIAAFGLFFLLGWPVVLAILLPAVAYLFLNDIPIALIGQRMSYALDSFPLVAVPIFIFVGNFMNQAGITERIFRFADTLVGRVPGGLGQVNIFASLIFSGMSGAALADIGGLGRIEVKAMTEHGFKPRVRRRADLRLGGGRPDLPAEHPAHHLWLDHERLDRAAPAGRHRARPDLRGAADDHRRDPRHAGATFPRAERWSTPARDRGATSLPALPALLTPVLLVGGMLLGLFTPTEAASVTAVYVILISAFVYRALTWRHLLYAAYETLKSTSAILIIVSAAAIFGWILAIEQVPQVFARQLAVAQHRSAGAAPDRQRDPADRRHVPRQHHGDAPGDPDHRSARCTSPGSIRCTSGSSPSSI